MESNSVRSLSCLHVAEHIGLGRYGDPLDPHGTLKACRELARVLAPGGNLYFSLPVGKPRLCFNAHRIHSVGQILDYFRDLSLVELSGIDDERRVMLQMEKSALDNADYGCGLFHFTKK
jgi:SAM-dependent methyltransferase